MNKTQVYMLNAFTDGALGGNPAGLVFGLKDRSEAQMIKIAQIVGFSETAFLEKISNKEYEIRYFTPAGEVDLCGHATIATFCYLKNKKMIDNGKYTLRTKAGLIDIIVEDNNVTMTQNLPEFFEIIEKEEILDCFYNLKKEDLIEDLPIQGASTGLKDFMIPIKSLDTLLNLKPNFDKISKITKKYSAVSFHLFSFETKNPDSIAHVRDFAPLYEVSEESATGTANGALSCYLFKYCSKDYNIDFSNLIFEQGYSLNKPSKICAKLEIADDKINRVYVGGNAVEFGSKII